MFRYVNLIVTSVFNRRFHFKRLSNFGIQRDTLMMMMMMMMMIMMTMMMMMLTHRNM